ncbi:MAG: hypothetical protein PHX82_17000 [Paracoccaceae bacterium]|nr:hypothetical protein [Paracoccaceae bacterium]
MQQSRLAGCVAAEAQGADCAAGATGGIAQAVYGGSDQFRSANAGGLERRTEIVGAIFGYLFSGGKANNVSAASAIFVSGIAHNACNTAHGGCWTTLEEQKLLKAGDYLGYYGLACASGDAYACYAKGIASEHLEGVWGLVNWGKLTTERLQSFAVKYKGRELTSEEMANIRINLAGAYAALYKPSFGEARWPLESEIIELHWSVFEKFSLPPQTFGGTPIWGMGEDLTQFLTDWCPNCVQDR